VGLSSLACPSAGACVAAGGYIDAGGSRQAMTAVETGSSWGQALRLTLPADATTAGGGQDAGLNSVTCADPGDCVLVGSYRDLGFQDQAMVAVQTGGVPAQASKLSPPADAAAGGYLASVSCPAPGQCIAAGGYTDANGLEQAMAVSSVPSLAFTPPSLPAATVGSPYGAQLSATGGTRSYAWSVTAGSLPAGLSLNATTGAISGTPTTAGTSSLTLAVSDPGPPVQQASGALSLIVSGGPPATTVTPPTPSRPPAARQITRKFGDQLITLTAPAAGECTSRTGRLSLKLIAAPLKRGAVLRLRHAAFYLDKGIKHTHRVTVRIKRHGRTIVRRRTVTAYTADASVARLPATARLSLTHLTAGTHTLTIKLAGTETRTVRIKRHGKTVTIHRTVPLSATITITITVC
jgi:hypothetical protein